MRNINPLDLALAFIPLEPRWMLDGAAVGEVAKVAADTATKDHGAVSETPPPAPQAAEPRKEVAFIDTSVADYQSLAAGVRAGVEVQLIDGGASGVAQLAAWAASHSGYDAIHILSHGSNGEIWVGGDRLDSASVIGSPDLSRLGSALAVGGDILVYGCDAGRGDAGQAFVRALAQVTGRDVAASTDATGATGLSGDWVLESASGTIDTAAMEFTAFTGLLAAPGARSLVVGTGGDAELYLGGNYIELGINKAGNFGASVAPTTNPGDPSFFGAAGGGTTRTKVGLGTDLDGFGVGTAVSFDFFQPGSPTVAWCLGVNNGSDRLGSNSNSGNGQVDSVTENIASTVTDETAGNTMQGKIVSVWSPTGGGQVTMTQVISFGVDDRYYTTQVTIQNSGAVDLSNVRYGWYVDPDNSKDVGGSYDTTNTVLNTFAAGDTVARVVASRVASENLPVANLFIESTDNRARVVNSAAGSSVYNASMYDSVPAKNSTNNNDTTIGIYFAVGSITAGNSVTFTYTTRLTSETVSQITGGGTTTTTTEVVRQSPTKSETPPPPSPPQQASAPPPSEARTLNVSKAEGGTPIMAALRSDGGAAEAKAIGMQTIVREAAPPSSEAAGLRPGEGSSAPSRSADAAPSLSPVLSAPADGGFRTAVLSGVSGIATGETIVVAKPIGEVIQLNRVSFAIPADAFAVARADSQVVLQATLADGRPLPVWLKFNPGTGRFEGTPPSGERGFIDIKVSARDSTGGQATQVFKMEVRGQGADAGTAVPTSRHAFAGKAGLAEQIRTARATAGRAARAG